jgi:hypothetical protein
MKNSYEWFERRQRGFGFRNFVSAMAAGIAVECRRLNGHLFTTGAPARRTYGSPAELTVSFENDRTPLLAKG